MNNEGESGNQDEGGVFDPFLFAQLCSLSLRGGGATINIYFYRVIILWLYLHFISFLFIIYPFIFVYIGQPVFSVIVITLRPYLTTRPKKADIGGLVRQTSFADMVHKYFLSNHHFLFFFSFSYR